MICPDCRKSNHDSCPGGTWCDCQHKGQHGGSKLAPRSSASRDSDNAGTNVISNVMDTVVDFFS